MCGARHSDDAFVRENHKEKNIRCLEGLKEVICSNKSKKFKRVYLLKHRKH